MMPLLTINFQTINTTVIISTCIILLSSGLLFYFLNKKNRPKNLASQVSSLTHDGLLAFLKRVFSSILQTIVYTTLVLLLFSNIFKTPFSWIQILSFFIGGSVMILSTLASAFIGPRLIPKVIQSSKQSCAEGLRYSFGLSASVSFFMVGFMIAGLMFCYLCFGIDTIIGYGLGLILSAFFLTIGGANFKSATDISADTVGYIEKNIPKFDRRNPATILDLTGDYVGNIFGFSADILGSFSFSLIASLLFPFSLLSLGKISPEIADKLYQLPLFIISLAFLISIIIYFFSIWRISTSKATNFLLEGLYIAVIVSSISTYFFIDYLDISINTLTFWGSSQEFNPFFAYMFGIIGAVFIGFTSELLTSSYYKPTKLIAKHAEFGPVISFFQGFSNGLVSNGLFLLYLLGITIPSFVYAGFYGISMAALGMLSLTSLILCMNIFSPLVATSAKIGKLSDSHDIILANTRRMDRIGHTTAALGKGFSSGAAILSTFALFFPLLLLTNIDLSILLLMDTHLLTGILIGIILPFLFSGFLVKGLIKSILTMFKETSRQFKEIPYLYEDKANPDIKKAADFNTCVALDSLIIPAIITLLFPISFGYIFGIKHLVGIVLGTILSGFSLTFYWANFGETMHHARKHIENGYYGGPKSTTFKHISIVDNIGDGFKDLLSPSINILIKSVTIVSILVIIFLKAG